MSEQNLSNDTSKQVDKRWWEFYFVRYFVGSVVGMGVIIFLNTAEGSPLKEKIFPSLANLKDAEANHLVLMAALGLAYCYIASAPILVMHMTRANLDFKRYFFLDWRLLLGGGVTTTLILWFFCALQNTVLWSWQFWSLVFVALVFAFQAMLIGESLFTKFQSIYDYYKNLSRARADTSRVRAEFVESYRHLREHGNSFSIVFLELGFALALGSVKGINVLVLLVIVWIAPACLAWLIGTYLESRLADVPTK